MGSAQYIDCIYGDWELNTHTHTHKHIQTQTHTNQNLFLTYFDHVLSLCWQAIEWQPDQQIPFYPLMLTTYAILAHNHPETIPAAEQTSGKQRPRHIRTHPDSCVMSITQQTHVL